MRLRERLRESKRPKKEKETKKETESVRTPRSGNTGRDESHRVHSQPPTWGEGDTLAPLNKPLCVPVKYSATQWRTPAMETIGLNNLEQYFTIIHTMSFPSHRLHCRFLTVQNPTPHPLC